MATRANKDLQLSNDRIIDRIYKNQLTKSLFPYFWALFKKQSVLLESNACRSLKHPLKNYIVSANNRHCHTELERT